MNEAWRRLSTTSGGSGLIASTDGDTRMGPGWLAATLAEVRAGADAVGMDAAAEVDSAAHETAAHVGRIVAVKDRVERHPVLPAVEPLGGGAVARLLR